MQLPGSPGNIFDNMTNPLGLHDEDEELNPSDSGKQKKIRKPLESYLFDDSTRLHENFVWHVDTYRNKIHMTVIDTAMNSLELYPFYRDGVGHSWQGNLGGATVPLNYFERPRYANFNFGQAYDVYNFFPDNTNFFNVKHPFTQFSYFTAGQKKKAEENFGIRHAQNISPSTGFNIDYLSRGTRGQYAWSKGRAKNLSMAVSHTGKKYTLHAGYIYNTINNKENGGLLDDKELTDSIYELPENIPMQLDSARNVIKNNTYYIVQSYGIPLRRLTDEDFTIADQSTIFVGHSFEYSRWHRNYSDTYNSVAEGFYDNWFIHPTITQDSIFESLLANRIFVQLQPWDRDGIIGVIDAGVGMDRHYYYQFRPSDYMTGKSSGNTETEYYLYGSVGGKFRRYLDWGGDIKFHPAGYRSGDLDIKGRIALSAYIKGRPITLSGKFNQRLSSPSYWDERFYSNHFMWSNSFSKEKETRFEVALQMPSAGIELGAAQSVITDKIFRDANALPAQASESVSVTGVYARKDFTLGGFHLNHRVLLQWSTSQEIIPVPLGSAFLSYYFEFNVVRNVLRMQLGVDGRINTSYYAQGWEPATAQFYNQREKKVGEYPMLDVFVNAKWKRMRILLKMEHLNENMFGTRNFFSVPHYPLNPRVFKIGMSWSFYD